MRRAQSIATISIPFVAATIGFCVQKSIANASTRSQYVSLAISILKEPAKNKDEPIRVWAADLLQRNSEVKMSEGLLSMLRSGDTTLSGIAILGPTAPDVSIEPQVTATGK